MGITTNTYDNDGALIAETGDVLRQFLWHPHTRLPMQLTGPGGSFALCYDSLNRRIVKTAENPVHYRRGISKDNLPLVEHYGGEEYIVVFTPAGQTVTRREGVYTLVARDHLSSVRAVRAKNVFITVIHSAYGSYVLSGGVLRYAFVDYEFDPETSLYHAYQRMYSPRARRFISVNPILYHATPYPYCRGDPFNRRDIDGQISSAVVSGILGALVLIGSLAMIAFSAGAAAPAVVPADVALGSAEAAGSTAAGAAAVGEGAAAGAAAAEAGAAGGAAEGLGNALVAAAHDMLLQMNIGSAMPNTLGSATWMGAKLGYASTLIPNAGSMIVKAAQGEHVSAWQAIRELLIEPFIGAGAGAAGGAFSFALAAKSELAATILGPLLEGTLKNVATTAVRGEIGNAAAWKEIGIDMAVSLAENLLLMPISMQLDEPSMQYQNQAEAQPRNAEPLRPVEAPREPNPQPYRQEAVVPGNVRGQQEEPIVYASSDMQQGMLASTASLTPAASRNVDMQALDWENGLLKQPHS
ncbi:MAG: hypothetical protein LBG83_05045 [Oscillospiraceae bacterium]|jgi:RHS repeat-associated protein|nr:hypothetical protein [Oscillospiraceae bacterium]